MERTGKYEDVENEYEDPACRLPSPTSSLIKHLVLHCGRCYRKRMEQTSHRSVLRRLQSKTATLVQGTVTGYTDKINVTLILPTNFSLCRIQTHKEEKLSQQMFKNTSTRRIMSTVVNSNFSECSILLPHPPPTYATNIYLLKYPLPSETLPSLVLSF